MGKMLFVASLPTKTIRFNGEVNKSKDVLEALQKVNSNITIIDYTKNKYFQTLRMIICLIFKRYDIAFVSKCIVGGSIALSIIMKFKRKRCKTAFYIYGYGDYGFDKKAIKYNVLNKVDELIVETPIVSQMMKQYRAKDCLILPVVKKTYSLPVKEIDYSQVKTLKAIFFSRIYEHKGILDAAQAIIEVNKRAGGLIKYTLDISGGLGDEQNSSFISKIRDLCSSHEELTFIGTNLRIDGEESYQRLQDYDLHIFPSKFDQECAPGSVIDMFIAGVPTLTSSFPSSHYMMSEHDSYFFKTGDIDDLVKQLEEIYQNKEQLNNKRVLSNKKIDDYSQKHFIDFLKNNQLL